jgi:hypothetical protein
MTFQRQVTVRINDVYNLVTNKNICVNTRTDYIYCFVSKNTYMYGRTLKKVENLG